MHTSCKLTPSVSLLRGAGRKISGVLFITRIIETYLSPSCSREMVARIGTEAMTVHRIREH